MFKKKSAVISENQNNKVHFLTNFIIFHFKNIDFKNNSNVKKAKSK